MNTIVATMAAALFTLSAHAVAAGTEHTLGEHPAVIVKQMYDTQGYDYASKFYPHPAGLYLYSQEPKETSQGTAVPIGIVGAQTPEPAGGSQEAPIIAKKR